MRRACLSPALSREGACPFDPFGSSVEAQSLQRAWLCEALIVRTSARRSSMRRSIPHTHGVVVAIS
eukprot:11164125-Lingulodinium_polyedra.AAC.1